MSRWMWYIVSGCSPFDVGEGAEGREFESSKSFQFEGVIRDVTTDFRFSFVTEKVRPCFTRSTEARGTLQLPRVGVPSRYLRLDEGEKGAEVKMMKLKLCVDVSDVLTFFVLGYESN
ncbi:hypothetical protein ACFE04_025406 [Oxalis oulophora]